MYPVGSVYINFNNEDPSSLIGGIWERIKGKFLLGVDENDTDFSEAGLIGGEKAHLLTQNEMARHNHGFLGGSHSFLWGQSNATVYSRNAVAVAGKPPQNELCTIQNIWTRTDDNTTTQVAHNNLPPYETVYIWRRIG